MMSNSNPLPRTSAVLAFTAIPLFMLSCRSGAGRMEETIAGKTVYARVCQHAEYRDGFFKGASTNYIELPDKFPVGSEFKVISVDRNTFVLGDKRSGKELRLEFVEKHNRKPAPEWFNENFSLAPVKLPSDLSAVERKNVTACTGAEGMSREALFLAVGYPPASLTSDRAAPVLIYQAKRFNKIQFSLQQNTVTNVKD